MFYRIHRLSYLAYADDLLLISRTEPGLARSVRSVAGAFVRIGLLLIVDKCELLICNRVSSSHPLDCSSFSVPQVISFRWLWISACNSLNSFRFQTILDIQFKLKLGYSSIVGNRGYFRRQALTKLYSILCDDSVLFCAGFYMLLNKGDVRGSRRITIDIVSSYCIYHDNFSRRKLISKYKAPDIVLSVEKLSSKLIDEVPIRLGPNNHLIHLFC